MIASLTPLALSHIEGEGHDVDPDLLERFMERADIESESWYWKRNNIRGYLKILGFVHDDPL